MVIKMNEKESGVMIIRRVVSILVFVLLPLIVGACYVPGLGALGEAEDPPEGEPQGVEDTYYGKFVIYTVGAGKIKTLGKGLGSSALKARYFVGDETYFPSNDVDDSWDYNIDHNGDEDFLDFKYDDEPGGLHKPASARPEAIVSNEELALYYTNHRDMYSLEKLTTSDCDIDMVGDSLGNAYRIDPADINDRIFMGMINSGATAGDVDTYSISMDESALVVARVRMSSNTHSGIIGLGTYFKLAKKSEPYTVRHNLKLSVLSASGGTVAESTHGPDFFKWIDPEVTFHALAGATYYIQVRDLSGEMCRGRKGNEAIKLNAYWLWLDTIYQPDDNYIYKGEIQPARSGNTRLDGGPTFEPDDLATVIEDTWPDCDGVPGSGDEGDAGVFEQCGSDDYGAGDGAMQYQEVDDKSAVDDGEFFIGKQTNIPAVFDSEASIIHSPDSNSLLMFINYGSRIYMLESLDGEAGLEWDLSNLVTDNPSVVPLNKGYDYVPGEERLDSKAPVVSSGPLGFCDTVPASGDEYAASEIANYATAFGTTLNYMLPEGTTNEWVPAGYALNAPVGFPHTYAVTFGDNEHLDSDPLVDRLRGNAIYSGPDGIINTMFAPQYEASANPALGIDKLEKEYSNLGAYGLNPVIKPEDLPGERRLMGPGRPDDPVIYCEQKSKYLKPLSGETCDSRVPLNGQVTHGSNRGAYLLGDDQWNREIFRGWDPWIYPTPFDDGNTLDPLLGDTMTPAAYWQKQHCNFYDFGFQFDKCALASPVDPDAPGYRATKQPVAIYAGSDNVLDTAQSGLRGDDVICRQGATVGICPGPNGKFDWHGLYDGLSADDRLEIVMDTGNTLNPGMIVGIGPGQNGVLESPIKSSYSLSDLIDSRDYIGGDYYCQTIDGYPAICPGLVEKYEDQYSGTIRTTGSRKLMTLWPMYTNSPDQSPNTGGMAPKRDLYAMYDDELCIINGQIAICPGVNGYFQSYPLSRREEIDSDEDLFNLYDRVSQYVGRDCYSLASEIVRDQVSETDSVRYVLYRYRGVRHDDMVKWNPVDGYHVTTGYNGINQSCVAAGDVQEMGFNKGLPDVSIISPGPDGRFQTYPLADEVVYWGDGIYKISTGKDGVANSYIMGDDRLEILFGTGKADHPCVDSGSDGRADTTAQRNDTQLYYPGEYTGFDAYSVWGPEATVKDGKIFLYYSALGWSRLPEQFPKGRGSLSSSGECKRIGLDLQKGRNETDSSFDDTRFERVLTYPNFRRYLDNNQGVMIAPRIGVATASMSCLRDPARSHIECWSFRNTPALGVGEQCMATGGALLSLGGIMEALPGAWPDINWFGAFSPDVQKTQREDGQGELFLMFYTGLTYWLGGDRPEGWNSREEKFVQYHRQVGLARSSDGMEFQQVRDVNPLIAQPDDFLSFALWVSIGKGDYPSYAAPTVISAGYDQYGEPAYGMFFNSFFSTYDVDPHNVEILNRRKEDHIGYAIRSGKSYFACSLSSDHWMDNKQEMRSILQISMLAVPVVIILAFRLVRRRRD